MRAYKVFLGWVMLFSILLVTACGGDDKAIESKKDAGSNQEAEALVHVLYQALDDGDVDKALGLFSLSDFDEEKKAKVQVFLNKQIPNAAARIKRLGGLDKLEIVSSKMSATNKRVTLTIKIFTMNGDSAEETLLLKKEEDGWKIVNIE